MPFKKTKSLPILGWSIWLLAAIFYAYEFILRIAPAMLTKEFMVDFAIDATTVGYISAAYYYPYAILQIPAGFLLDKYSYKFILILSSITVSIGSFMLSEADSVFLAQFARAILGAGSAFAFCSCLKIASIWLPNKQFPFIVGMTNLFAVIGAKCANEPLAYYIDLIGWRDVITYLALLGIIISIVLLFIPSGKQHYSQKNTVSSTQLLAATKQLITSKDIWFLALYGGLLFAPVSAFADLWGTAFVKTLHSITKQDAAAINVYIFYGMALGGPVIGFLASRGVSVKKLMLYCTFGVLICMLSILYLKTTILTLKILLFVYGMLTSNMLLCFSVAKYIHYNQNINVLSISFINMIVMIFGTIFQPLIGKFLTMSIDLAQTTEFSITNYMLAFSILPLCLIVAMLVCTKIKDVNLAKYK